MSKTVVIAGAGIVGISTAVWLQRAGQKVIVVDRLGPAGGTSYGNAGVLAAASVVPVTVPGLIRKAPGMLLDSKSPLFLKWSYLPRLLPFLWRYLANANEKSVERISVGLHELLHDCAEQHRALCAGTPAERYFKAGDYVFGYASKADFEADSYGWNVRKRRGFEFEEMDEARIAEYDPVMAGRFGYAVRCPEHGQITDPGEYVKALANHVESEGGTFVTAEIDDIVCEQGKARGLSTSEGLIEGDDVVIATGVWSDMLARKLGIESQMESERGYHLEFVDPSVVPKSPVMVASGKFVMTPMEGRLRCAGIVEFGGLKTGPSTAPFELLMSKTLEIFPELTYAEVHKWMGHRPSTSDSLPLIGASESVSNVWSAFGHQHIGLSGGPKTGRWVSQMILGDIPNIDLAIFSPARFN